MTFEEWWKKNGASLMQSDLVYHIALSAWKAADRNARKECAAIAGSMAERPYEFEPEFSAVLAVEAAIYRTIKP